MRAQAERAEASSAAQAGLEGLAPTEWTIHTEQQSPIATAGERIAPRSEGGHGFVSCDAVRSWVLIDVPETHAPTLQLNVTSGTVSAEISAEIPAEIPAEVHRSTETSPARILAMVKAKAESHG